MFQRSKKGLVLLLGTAMIFITSAAVAQDAQEKEQETKEAVQAQSTEKVAVVNGTVITQKVFQQETEAAIQRMAMQGQQPDPQKLMEIRKDILENMINRELLYQYALKEGFKADPEEIEAQFAELKGQFPDEEQFKQVIERMKTTEEQLKGQIRQRLVVQKFIEERISKDIEITDKEVKEFYGSNQEMFQQPEQIHARHILIKSEPDATEADKAEARKKIGDVQEKVEKGGDFAELAKEHSEGPSSDRGGDLGFFGRGQMVKAFEDAAFALEAGEVSDVVETQFGYHLIKKEEGKPASTLEYEKVKDRLQDLLKQQKVQEKLAGQIEEIKKDAKIERFL